MKKILWATLAYVAIFSSGLAHADSITANVSGDDNISYWNGSAWVAEGNNWHNAETINLTVTSSSDVVYFAVANDFTAPTSSFNPNPSDFLGSFTDNSGTFTQTGTNTLLSNTTNFKILAVSPWFTPITLPGNSPLSTINPTVDPTTLSGFITPTSYGTNGNPLSQTFPYYNSLGEAVPNIDPNAQWIWTGNNTGIYQTEDDYAIIGVDLGVNVPLVTPEPPTLLLFAFAGAMLVLFNRIKLFPTLSS